MKKNALLLFVVIFLAAAILFMAGGVAGTSTIAKLTDPQTMPDVITLGKDAKLGSVTFEHKKHNDGTYKPDGKTGITCVQCHHTAQPGKAAWPADRKETATLELFTKDPKAAGIASCHDCHTRTGDKPKLIADVPQVTPAGATSAVVLNNQQAFHRSCTTCHVEAKKNNPATKAPQPMQCTMCHKKAA